MKVRVDTLGGTRGRPTVQAQKAEALRNAIVELLKARAPERMHFAEIRSALIAQGHRFDTSTLESILDGFRIPSAAPASPPVPRPARVSPAALAVELALQLHKLEVDAVEVAQAASGAFRLRIDKVAAGRSPLWLSAWLGTPVELPSPPAGFRWMLLRGWRLPLVPLSDPASQLPALGVLKFADVRPAAAAAHAITQSILGPDVGCAKVAVEECEPVEANRRQGAAAMVNRRRARGTPPSRFAETVCLKCGMPLSDPDSVKIGIGPECRRHLGADVVQALRQPDRARSHVLGARSAQLWVGIVAQRFTAAAATGSLTP